MTTFDNKRRERVSFDAFYFENEAAKGQNYDMQKTFEHIKEINLWGANESVSGLGSTFHQTEQLREMLPTA